MSNPQEVLEQQRLALAVAWNSLPRSEQRKVAVVEYYCQVRSCPLLTVFQAPDGLLVALPRYRKSPQRNAAGSVASARAKRTVDGDRRWRARVALLEEFADPLLPQWGVEVNCDHVSKPISGVELLGDVQQGCPGSPFIRRW
jgi:hypothetical protein